MITKRALRLFLAQARKDYRSYKKLKFAQLQTECDQLPIKPPIWKRLRKHQRACFLLGAKLKRFGFYLDMGMGKTLLSIALIRYFFKLKTVKHTLVVVPKRVNKYTWVHEIKKHSPNTSYCVLTGSSANKWQQLESTDAKIIVESIGGLMLMLCTKIWNKKKKKVQLKPHIPSIKRMQKKVQGIIADESTYLGNRGKLPFRLFRQLTKTTNFFFELTGTPFGRDPTPLWAQLFLLDRGETLGKTLGMFRAAFFSSTENFWGGMDHKFLRRKMPLIHQFIANRTIRYEADQGDLPRLTKYIEYVNLPDDAEVYADRAKETILAARGNFIEMRNAFLRMRQISSGFLGYYDDDQGTKAKFVFPTNPKLELLLEKIESIRPDRKIIVFHDFIFSGDVITKELKKLEIGFVRLYRKTQDPADILDRFDNDPKCRVFALNNSMAIGLNLQVAKYGIFYEAPVPVLVRKQAIRRFERQESEHEKVFLIDLVTRGTYDERILEFHAQGKTLFEGIIEGKRRS